MFDLLQNVGLVLKFIAQKKVLREVCHPSHFFYVPDSDICQMRFLTFKKIGHGGNQLGTHIKNDKSII